MKTLTVRQTGHLALEMKVAGRKTERLSIDDPFYPRTAAAISLFRSLGTMHLVAPYLPRIIATPDFTLERSVFRLIGEMYASCDRSKPMYRGSLANNDWSRPDRSGRRCVVAYSAGKDSLWNMMNAQNRFGPDNVMAVHISGLNPSSGSGERDWSFLQAERLEFPHFRTVQLRNGSKSSKTGYQVMRSRDVFMTGILVPIALQFGARYILTEGFAEMGENEPYTGNPEALHALNRALKKMGIPVSVIWKDLPEMDVIRELYEQRPGWMPQVHNCFSMACYKPGIARSWRRRAPSIPMYDSQCGSCVKCRITNIARIHYDPVMRLADSADLVYYLKDTATWLRSKGDTHADMLTPSFWRDYTRARREHGLAT